MTTIVLVRKNKDVVVASDGQVSMGNTVIKSTANKVRKISNLGKYGLIFNFLFINSLYRYVYWNFCSDVIDGFIMG